MTMAEMVRLYQDDGLSLRQIGARCGLSHSVVWRRLSIAGVTMRQHPVEKRLARLERELLQALQSGVWAVRAQPMRGAIGASARDPRTRIVIETRGGRQVVFTGQRPHAVDPAARRNGT